MCRIIVIFTTVSEPVELTVIPKSVVTVKHFDSPIRVNCSARGVPRPNITWYKEGVAMPTRIIINGDEITAELNLERLRPSEQGDYNCVGVTSVRPDEPFIYSTKIREYSSFSTFHRVYVDASVKISVSHTHDSQTVEYLSLVRSFPVLFGSTFFIGRFLVYQVLS